MICSYEYDGQGCSKITPSPLFWDSFYLAGDDILRNLVQNVVIEGKEHHQPNLGNLTGALTARICAMSDNELLALPCLDNVGYMTKVNDIWMTANEEEKKEKKDDEDQTLKETRGLQGNQPGCGGESEHEKKSQPALFLSAKHRPCQDNTNYRRRIAILFRKRLYAL